MHLILQKLLNRTFTYDHQISCETEGDIKRKLLFIDIYWLNLELRACGLLFKLTILVLDFQRSKCVVLHMSETRIEYFVHING